MKSFLVAAMLLGGGNCAWAVTNTSTVTGMVGATDNSSGFNTIGNKAMPLAAGDEYVITFVNFNKGASGTNYWANWSFISDVFNCRADRGDSNPWWGSATNVNYSGSSWTDISSTINEWLQAYDGVTVTLTVSRDVAGTGLMVAHTATTNAVGSIASQTYAGTFTATVGASAAINFYLTVENAHLNITKVVYTNADDGGTIYCTPNHTASSSRNGSNTISTTVDQEFEHYNNTKAAAWGGWAYAEFPVSIPDGASVSNAALTWNTKIGGNSGTRNNDIYYVNSGTTINYADLTSSTNLNLDGTFITNETIAGPTTRTQTVTDVTTAVSTIKASQNFIIFKWTNNAAGADLYGKASEYPPCLAISYTKETLYTATFAEGNSLSPTITIYSDPDRSAEVTNGTLTNGTTYYYKATLAGYHDCLGSFTVDGADPNVNFTMTAKTVYNFSVNAIDGESGIIKAGIVYGTCYADETTSYYLPDCVLIDGTLYFREAEDSYKSVTVTSNNQVFTYEYTNTSVNNVVFFVEGESISGAATSTATNNQRLASNGYMGRGSNLAVTTLPSGSYTIYVHYINTNASGQSVVVKAGDTDVINNASVSARPTINGSVTLTKSTDITLTAAASSTSGVDYLYIVKTGETATLGTNGYTTFASPYAIDLTTANLSGVTAYKAAVEGNTVRFTALNQTVPANTGILLEGSAGAAVSIPVVATGTEVSGNDFKVNTAGTTFTAETGYTYYGMIKDSNPLTFGTFAPGTVAIPADKAYLQVANTSSARLTAVFGDEMTGISTLNSEVLNNNLYYDLQGRTVAQPTKGMYIVNGKKVIMK